MKKAWLIIAAMALSASLFSACSCTPEPAPTPSAKPSPTLAPTEAPTPTPIPVSTPAVTSTGTPGLAAEGTIPNFSAGTVVEAKDVPAIKEAIEKLYPGATIQSIKHAKHEEKQVYDIALLDKNAKKIQCFMLPDGTVVPATTATPSTAPSSSPKASSTPKTSTKPKS